MNSSKEFIQNMKPEVGEPPFKLASVDSLFANGDPKLLFDGETVASEKHYPYLDSYTPTAGDRVELAFISGTYVIQGKIIFNG